MAYTVMTGLKAAGDYTVMAYIVMTGLKAARGRQKDCDRDCTLAVVGANAV